MNAPIITTDLVGYVWNTGEEPTAIRGEEDYDRLRAAVCQLLEEKEFGKIVLTRPGEESFEMLFQAWTDPQRGRVCVAGIGVADLVQSVADLKKHCELKCFTPNEIYALAPIRTHSMVYHLLQVHMQEIDWWGVDYDAIEATKRIEIRNLADECPDGRRTWTLESVWFDGKPVMVVNSSGRDGDEYHDRYITDKALFEEMVTFLRSFLKPEEINGLVDGNKVIPEMTEFYNATIHSYYDTEKQTKRDDDSR